MNATTKYFKYFLTETATGLIYYRDMYGNRKTGNVMDGVDYSLPQEPYGWEDIEISYKRNTTYWGINRSFTIPLKFVGDGAFIIRSLFYEGKGTEQPITLVITKWDESLGAYVLYYHGQLDLTQNVNMVAESITVNVMEGGIIQLLKSYENTIIELPCDGSIPENIKFLADGIKFNDTFHYQILKLSSPYAGLQALPMTFISNDGDNIGVIHRDQNLENPYANYTAKSANACFTSITPTTVNISGSISVKSDPSIHNTSFYMVAVSSLSQPRGVGDFDHAIGLTLPQNPDSSSFFIPAQSQVTVDGQQTFSFNGSISLAANENLFIMFFNDFAANPIQILGGNVNLAFSSRLAATRIWGISAPNVWKLIGQRLCALASTTDYPFSYPFESNFLQTLERFVITSGDAIRASSVPNYYQYYNQVTLNPANPNNTFYNQFPTLGPTIKISIADFFNSLNPIKPSSIGNQLDNTGKDSIFFESRDYVLNPSAVSIALGQVANFQISPDTDKLFNWLEIGYQPNQYDETSGKYEYNNTSKFQAGVKSIAKTFQLISSKGRTDSNGFEFTRYNTQGGKSTTFNSSDSDWWFINCDFSSFIYDYYSATFLSGITNTQSTANTNILLNRGLNFQPVICGTLDGEYFINNNDFSIFMLNSATTLPAGSQPIKVTIQSVLNGLPGDTATIKFFINGAVVQSWSQAITGVNTPLNASFTVNRVLAYGDNFYFTISTVGTCTAQINQMSLNCANGYFIAQNSGPINFQASSTEQLISLPVITAVTYSADGSTYQVVSYGFQYFRFLSNVQQRTFNWSVALSGFIQSISGFITFDLWKNGVKIGEVIYNGTTVQTTWNPTNAPQFIGTDTYNNYDMYWLTASCTNTNAWITNVNISFTSTSIKVYKLLRVAYDSVTGIPNPETAFNTEDFTPMRMLISNGSILRSILYMIGPSFLTFQTADKNEFLSTTKNGVTIAENSSVSVQSLANPLWLPLIMQFETQIPWTAKQIFDATQNGYISFQWKGKTFYGFPLEVSIKPALNDKQTWKLLAAPTNLLSDMVELDWDGLQTLQNMDSTVPYINGLHFIPLNYTKDSRYNSSMMDEDFFVNRIQDYCDKNNYFAPWQTNDIIPLQCRTAGLDPVQIQVLNSKGQPIGDPFAFDSIITSAIQPPETGYLGVLNLASLLPGEGKYYFLWTMGTGSATASWISEGINVKAYWPKTQLYEYTNTRNKLSTIFNANGVPIVFCKRFFSQINKYTPKSMFTTFVDEPQDISLLNAIPYDVWNIDAGFGSGMPDYDIRLFERIWDLDTVMVDGNQLSRDADAQVDVQYLQGQPKAYCSLAVRKAKNTDGVTINTADQIEGPQQAGYVIDAQAFGTNNGGQNLIQVTGSNS